MDNIKNTKTEIYISDKNRILKEIGERLKHLRESLNASISDVARETGLSAAALRGYEQGKNETKSITLIKLALYFGTSVDFILFGDETNETIYKFTF